MCVRLFQLGSGERYLKASQRLPQLTALRAFWLLKVVTAPSMMYTTGESRSHLYATGKGPRLSRNCFSTPPFCLRAWAMGAQAQSQR